MHLMPIRENPWRAGPLGGLIVPPVALTSHTAPLTAAQAARLREVLEERGYEFEEKPYTLYAAKKGKLSVAVYAKGPKVLV